MNLLPNEEKLKIREVYRLRVFIISSALLSVLLVLMIAPIMASYLLVSYKAEFLSNELSLVRSTQASSLNPYINTISETNREIDLLGKTIPGSLKFRIYDLLKIISDYSVSVKDAKGAHLSVDNIAYEYRLPNKKEKTAGALTKFYHNSIAISGTASDRASLQNFIQLLKGNPKFIKVESPISNFVAIKDISFSVMLNINN